MENVQYNPSAKILLCRFDRVRGWNNANLAAPYWRLYHNYNQGGSVSLYGQTTKMEPDNVILIPPETPFQSKCYRPIDHFYVHFIARPPFDQVDADIFSFPLSGGMLETMNEAITGLEGDSKKSELRMSMLCLRLIHEALLHVPEGKLRPFHSDERIALTTRYMETNISDIIHNEDLAALARMNTNAFIRLFRQATGQTPQQYLTSKRVEKACVMLQYSPGSIDQIAEELGFCDRYYFSRVFKKIRGIGPAEYRKKIS